LVALTFLFSVMNSLDWFAALQHLKNDVTFLSPLLFLCISLVALIIAGVFHKQTSTFLYIALVGGIGSGAAYGALLPALEGGAFPLFFNSLVLDAYSAVAGAMVNIGFVAALFFIQRHKELPKNQELYLLLTGSVIGLQLMLTANQWIVAFIGMELSAIATYSLATFPKWKKEPAESGVKYIIYGSVASGILLYGISLLFAFTGNLYFLKEYDTPFFTNNLPPIALLGAHGFIMTGLSFKLGAFPFYFWVSDVYKGAPLPIAAYLATAVKMAAFVLAIRFVAIVPTVIFPSFQNLLALLAIATLLIGNIGALRQTNFKRLLAYSSIAHSGFLLIALLSSTLAGALLFYLIAYLVMQWGAFYICSLWARQMGSENIQDWKGQASRRPWLTFFLVVFFIGLIGLPPTAGFAAKFNLFLKAYAIYEKSASWWTLSAILVALLGTVLSLYYYLKVPAMLLFSPPNVPEKVGKETEAFRFSELWPLGLAVIITLLFGIWGFDKMIDFFQKNFGAGL
jgi:NADH-quinone oxidoreductase subunit N